MPKLKTHKGAAKRFKMAANGRIKKRRAFRNHILTKKSAKRMRHLRHNNSVCASDQKSIERMLQGS